MVAMLVDARSTFASVQRTVIAVGVISGGECLKSLGDQADCTEYSNTELTLWQNCPGNTLSQATL
jgi:hypothetical protein